MLVVVVDKTDDNTLFFTSTPSYSGKGYDTFSRDDGRCQISGAGETGPLYHEESEYSKLHFN